MDENYQPKMTLPTQLVLRALLLEPTREYYGLEIGQMAGLASGTIHPILARLENAGWLESRWEDVDPTAAGRPARRYYSLTKDGAERARFALAGAAAKRGGWAAALRPDLAGGAA